jgi:hypothetical protein
MAAPAAPAAQPDDDDWMDDVSLDVLYSSTNPNPVQEYARQASTVVVDSGPYAMDTERYPNIMGYWPSMLNDYLFHKYYGTSSSSTQLFFTYGHVNSRNTDERYVVITLDSTQVGDFSVYVEMDHRVAAKQQLESSLFTYGSIVKLLDAGIRSGGNVYIHPSPLLKEYRASYAAALEALRVKAMHYEAEKRLPLLDQYLLPDLSDIVYKELTNSPPARQAKPAPVQQAQEKKEKDKVSNCMRLSL